MIRPHHAAVLLLAPLALAACQQAAAPQQGEEAAVADAAPAAPDGPGIGVTGVTLRLSANPAAPSAAYLTLSGDGRPMTLTGVASPDAERVEMHESRRENGMMTMVPLASVDVPADGDVVFRAGGKHLMIFGIADAARRAGQVRLTLRFADGTSVDTVAQGPAPAAAAPAAPPAAQPAPTAGRLPGARPNPSVAGRPEPATVPDAAPAADPHAGMDHGAMEHQGH